MDENLIEELYPYPRSADFHELAFLFFNGPVKMDIEVADAMAKHIFDRLDCSPPREPSVKYDALGSAGAPWEPGAWIERDAERMTVTVTVPEKSVAQMDDAELAALRRDLDAAEVARKAGTLGGDDGR